MTQESAFFDSQIKILLQAYFILCFINKKTAFLFVPRILGIIFGIGQLCSCGISSNRLHNIEPGLRTFQQLYVAASRIGFDSVNRRKAEHFGYCSFQLNMTIIVRRMRNYFLRYFILVNQTLIRRSIYYTSTQFT